MQEPALPSRTIRLLERIYSRFGAFTLVSVRIENRTHASDSRSYGFDRASRSWRYAYERQQISLLACGAESPIPNRKALRWTATFLHAAELEFAHPRTGKQLHLTAELPDELTGFLTRLRTKLEN